MRFFNENKVISLLLLISILIIIKVSDIPYLYGFSSNFVWLFLKPSLQFWGYDIFRILENLSLAYISSCIFFLIVNYIPKRKQEKIAFEVIEPELVSLYLYMSTIISVYKHLLGIAKLDNEITKSDLKELPVLDISDRVYNFKKTTIVDGIESGLCADYFNLLHDSVKYGKLIKETLNKVSSLPCTVYLNYDFLKVISEIKSNNYLTEIHDLNSDVFIKARISVNRLAFDTDFLEFIKYHEELKNFKFKKFDYLISEISEEEINKNLEFEAKAIQKNPELLKIILALNSECNK